MFELSESSSYRTTPKKLSRTAFITVNLFGKRLGNGRLILRREQLSNDYF